MIYKIVFEMKIIALIMVMLFFFVSLKLLNELFFVEELAIYLLLSFLAYLNVKRDLIKSLVYLFWFVFFVVFIDDINPLASPDSHKYFSEAFGNGYYNSVEITDVINGHIPVIEFGGLVVKLISKALSTENLKVIVCFNIVLLVESAGLFSRFLKYKFNINTALLSCIFILISVSPAIVRVSLELLKDIYVLFGLSLIITLISRCEHISIKNSILIISSIIILSMLRPYFLLLLVSYLLVFFSEKKIYLYVSVLISLSYIVFGFAYLGFTPFGILTGAVASISSPNVTRWNNWYNNFGLTLESLFYTIMVSFFYIVMVYKKLWRNVFLYTYMLFFSGAILFGVSQNRVMHDINYSVQNTILNDDMSRKKIPFIPLYLCSFFVLTRKNILYHK